MPSSINGLCNVLQFETVVPYISVFNQKAANIKKVGLLPRWSSGCYVRALIGYSNLGWQYTT